jgi:hypothetical protein
MSEIEQVQATIARIERKLPGATPASLEYYKLCLAGWRAHLRKLQAGAVV